MSDEIPPPGCQFISAGDLPPPRDPIQPRLHHYRFAYRWMPGLIFHSPISAEVCRSTQQQLLETWALAGKYESPDDLEPPDGLDVEQLPFTPDSRLLLITMPPPRHATEAYYIGIVSPRQHDPAKIRYFILSHSAASAEQGLAAGCIRELTADRSNYRSRDFVEPTKDAFIAAIRELCQHPPNGTFCVRPPQASPPPSSAPPTSSPPSPLAPVPVPVPAPDSEDTTEYFLIDGQNQKGPFPLSTVAQAVHHGTLSKDALYWTQGLASARPLAEIADQIEAAYLRLHHYYFAYCAIPMMAWGAAEARAYWRQEASREDAVALWDVAGKEAAPDHPESPVGLEEELLSFTEDADLLLFTLPPPRYNTEAYYVAIRLPRAETEAGCPGLRIFLLVYGNAGTPQGPNQSSVRELRQEGDLRVYGPVEPSSQNFVRVVHALCGAPLRLNTEAEAQAEAVRRFPSLGTAGTRFNGEFLSRYHRYKQNRPDYFRAIEWPLHLAEETAQALR